MKVKKASGEIAAPRIIIHGEPKVGKSSLAAGLNTPFFIDLEDGTGSLNVDTAEGVKTFSDVERVIADLTAEDYGYKTIVIDSFTSLERLAQKEVAEANGKESVAKVKFGEGYADVLVKFHKILEALNKLRMVQKVAIVCIAHSSVTEIKDPDNGAYDQIQLDLFHGTKGGIGNLAAFVTQWADLIAYAKIRKRVDLTKEIKTAKPVGNERQLLCGPSGAQLTGGRYPLPDEMPLDAMIFRKHLGAAFAELKTQFQAQEAQSAEQPAQPNKAAA